MSKKQAYDKEYNKAYYQKNKDRKKEYYKTKVKMRYWDRRQHYLAKEIEKELNSD